MELDRWDAMFSEGAFRSSLNRVDSRSSVFLPQSPRPLQPQRNPRKEPSVCKLASESAQRQMKDTYALTLTGEEGSVPRYPESGRDRGCDRSDG
jgi:hypothetical protein